MLDTPEEIEEFFKHAGVKGMKWGKRQNPNYSNQQAKRDAQVYGNRGSKRINNAMNKGDQISTARGAEKTRRDNVMSKNKYVRQVGKLAGGVVGAGIGIATTVGLNKLASSSAGMAAAGKVFGKSDVFVRALNDSPIVLAAITAGAAKVGYMMAGDAAVSVNMRARGYNPNRK